LQFTIFFFSSYFERTGSINAAEEGVSYRKRALRCDQALVELCRRLGARARASQNKSCDCHVRVTGSECSRLPQHAATAESLPNDPRKQQRAEDNLHRYFRGKGEKYILQKQRVLA
jgi:hypothetical protein